MKDFFKKLGSGLLKGLKYVAKETASTAIREQITPYLAEKLMLSSKELVFEQMQSLLETVKSYLIELKLKTRTSAMAEDDMAFRYALSMLKEFSKSVMTTIDEIEAY